MEIKGIRQNHNAGKLRGNLCPQPTKQQAIDENDQGNALLRS